jgi:predicted PurR-regulated permease PerM
MKTLTTFPFYARLAFILLSLSIIAAFIYVGQSVLIPLLLSFLFAILLRPVVVFMTKKLKFPHVIAALLAVVLFVLFIASIITFVSWQIGDIADDWTKIKGNLLIHYHHIQQWVKEKLHVSYTEQQKYINKATNDSLDGGVGIMGNALTTFTNALLNIVLLPIYTFLLLLYRTIFIKFLFKLFKKEDESRLHDILFNIKIAIQSFLLGLLTEMGIVATLTSIGFLIIGLDYALLLGVITGILNLIPYVGITFAGLLAIFATLTSSTDLSIIMGTIIVNSLVQLIDNNILVPMVVSSKVKVNAIVSLIAIVIGGALAGVAGMFLAIPVVAIVKVIFDRVESLEPWGFVMGDELPKTYEWKKLRLPSFNAGDSETIHDKPAPNVEPPPAEQNKNELI